VAPLTAGAGLEALWGTTMSLEEVVEFSDNYNQQLRAMKRPAKEEINALTMVANDYVDSPPFAAAVVQVLERSIDEVMPTSHQPRLSPLLACVRHL